MSIYNKALDIAANIEKETSQFPRNTYYLVNLLNRAVDDITTNIAKANEHIRSEERKDFFWSARGSIQDCVDLLDVAARQGILNTEKKLSFKSTLEDLSADVKDIIRNSPQISEN